MIQIKNNTGFVRYEFYLSAFLLLIGLSVAVPQYYKHGFWSALFGFLITIGLIVASVVTLVQLKEIIGRHSIIAAIIRFLFFALFGTVVITTIGLVALHIPVRYETLFISAAAVTGGASGSLLYNKLTPERFWPAFIKFCVTLVFSVIGGILGMLDTSGDWGIRAGIFLPIIVFILLFASGRITPEHQQEEKL